MSISHSRDQTGESSTTEYDQLVSGFENDKQLKKLGEVLEKASLVAGTQKEAYRTKGTKCKPRKLSYSWLYPSRSANSHYSFWRSNALAFPRVQLFRKEIIMVKRKCIVNLRHYHWQRPVWVPKQCNLKEVELCQAHCDTSKQASKQIPQVTLALFMSRCKVSTNF